MNQRLMSIVGICVIAAIGMSGGAWAEFAKNVAGKSPWGPADEIGTLNMMTEMSRLEILERVASGRVYDLAVDFFVGMPTCCSDTFGDPDFQIWMTHVPERGGGSELLSHSGDAISMSTHTGTHIDALSHFGLRGTIWNEVDANRALGARGWSKSAADKLPPIVARGVMIDVARSKSVEHLPASYAITVADLQAALKAQQVTLRPGDAVVVRTGLMRLWPDASKLTLFQQAGLSLEAAHWLVEEKGAMLLGADNFGLENFPSGDPANFAPVHSYLLAERGVPFMEVLWLEDLAKDHIYEFLFVAAPLKLRGATGSPIRPLAIPIREDG